MGEVEEAARSEGGPSGGRLVQIDGLRAIAALTVVAYHYTTRYDYWYLHSAPIGLQLTHGVLGVCLFFAISGFVIFMTLDRIRAPLDFVVSRFSRLFPTYWTAVALTWLIVTLGGLPGHEVSWKHAIVNFTMLQSFVGVPEVDGVYWSLQVELVFYTWMLVLWAAGALKRPVAVCVVCAVWVAASLAAALGGRAHIPYTVARLLLLEWIPWFALGLMAYVTLREGAIRLRHALVVVMALAAIAVQADLVISAGALVTVAAIFGASRSAFPLLARGPLVFFGLISYPLYLVHENIGWLIILSAENLGAAPWLAIVLALAGCIGLATLLHECVEGPASKAIRGWYKRSKLAISARAFRHRVWAASGVAALCLLGAVGVVAARLQPEEDVRRDVTGGLRPVASTAPDCPHDASRPMRAIIVLGQSNAASHAQAMRPSPEVRVLGEGGCRLARDPLPGTTGNGASIWSAMLERVERNPANAELVLVPLAVESSMIGDWVGKGVLRPRLEDLLKRVRASGIAVVAVLAQLGESDAMHATPAARFHDDLLALRELLDRGGVRAPLVVAKSTYCRGRQSESLRRAIDFAAEHSTRIRAGPDTDVLRGDARIGVCHFSSTGRDAAALLWSRELVGTLQPSARNP